MLKVTYISHSGFLVELEEAYLLFDYYKGTIPEFNPKKKVYVFASHGHHDHFNYNVFNLLKRENEIHFILSDDIQVDGFSEVTLVGPNTELTVGGCRISTLTSTDEGVAFLAEYQGCNIYHAGDLNWWHWNGESVKYNEDMKVNYQREINKLKGKEIDIAFITLDPRLEDAYILGLDYFANQTNTKTIIPMHFWGNYEVFDMLKSNDATKDYIDKVICIREEGEVFCL
jgi:L-ascorbate metabolism protein UlaG (beta-lactamase superfamily)